MNRVAEVTGYPGKRDTRVSNHTIEVSNCRTCRFSIHDCGYFIHCELETYGIGDLHFDIRLIHGDEHNEYNNCVHPLCPLKKEPVTIKLKED